MRRLVALLLSTALAPLQFAQVTNQAVPVPRGTGVEVELLQDVSSKTLQIGQAIRFKLVRPIEVEGETLLPAGTPVVGVVETVQNAGHWGKNGALDLRLEPLKLTDGALVHIDFPRPQKKSEAREKVDRRADAAMAYVQYFPLVPFALIAKARKGQAFTIRSGERYLVYVTSTEAAPVAIPPESSKQ